MAITITTTTVSTVTWSRDLSTIVVQDQTGLAVSADFTGNYPGYFANIPNRFIEGAKVTNTTTAEIFTNVGTVTSPRFVNVEDLITTAEITASAVTTAKIADSNVTSAKMDVQLVKLATATLTAADIIATTAGSLSHAQGLILVPAAPTGYVNILHRAIVSYTFATAAFTGGGNNTFNIGGGGAAITGLIATTTLWQNASSIIQEFVPLSTVAFPVTKETSINLVTASAVTNPGTAAGSAKVYAWYSQVAI